MRLNTHETNPFRRALLRLRLPGNLWGRGSLHRRDFRGVHTYCLVGSLGKPRAETLPLVLETLADVIREQYPERAGISETNKGVIFGVNDRVLQEQEEAERLLEKAAVKWDEQIIEGEHQ